LDAVARPAVRGAAAKRADVPIIMKRLTLRAGILALNPTVRAGRNAMKPRQPMSASPDRY
jgi:hypothetical protein